jgi:hypothetical protein
MGRDRPHHEVMEVVSTDEVPLKERFAYWREMN